MDNMSQKDKKTLIIVAAVLIFVIGIVGIVKPAFTSMSEARAENKKVKSTKQTMETEIGKIPTYETDLVDAKSSYMDSASHVFGELVPDTIDNTVTNTLVVANGLSPQSFSINEIISMDPATYSLTYSADTGSYASTGGFIANPASNTTLANISISATGTYAQAIAFINTLNITEGIHLLNTSYSTTEGTTAVNASFLMVLSENMA